ncbi:MAG: YicC family protein [Lysobacteraceae bacterium]|nr:MAG: YicC family protein [Xanthomonadaceae bacterium]
MIRSMTAFAACERNTAWGTLTCELRSVNHRFLEIGMRLPEELRAIEPALRERISARITRGKLELSLRLRQSENDDVLRLNPARVAQLAAIGRNLQEHFPAMRVEMTQILQFPGVLHTSAEDPAALHADAQNLLEEALDQFVLAREREGGKLASVIRERVDAIAGHAAAARALMPAIRAGQRQKLDARLADLPQPLDPGRFEQELVLALQKLDVDEELDRLDSHLAEIRRVLGQREPAGRRLDFLLQEFNREANTFGSKSVDARTSALAVELKVLIDQIREQIQNIE